MVGYGERTFSERLGLVVRFPIALDAMPDSLRKDLWNFLDANFWQQPHFVWNDLHDGPGDIYEFTGLLWMKIFEETMDSRPEHPDKLLHEMKAWFFEAPWNRVYDFVEFTTLYHRNPHFQARLNVVLDHHVAAYRFVGGRLVQIVQQTEAEEVESALRDPMPEVREHLNAALVLFSRRPQPDYRNSIAESLKAAEAKARQACRDQDVTLGEALVRLQREGRVHAAIGEAFRKLYGHFSDKDGVRHATKGESQVGSNEARATLILCSTLIGYLQAVE